MAFYLSESRKYRLNWILAHQYLTQIEDKSLRESIFANVKTQIVFHVSAADAQIFLNELSPEVTIQDMVNLPNYEAYVRLLQADTVSRPFHIHTLPPPLKPATVEAERRKQGLITWSRNNYAVKRDIIESFITRFLDT